MPLEFVMTERRSAAFQAQRERHQGIHQHKQTSIALVPGTCSACPCQSADVLVPVSQMLGHVKSGLSVWQQQSRRGRIAQDVYHGASRAAGETGATASKHIAVKAMPMEVRMALT
jgi:hypothetical protein